MERDTNGYGAIEPNELVSGRELEVLQLVADGGTNESIGTALDISVKTVESHRTHISKVGLDRRQKLRSQGVKNVLTGLIIDGVRSGYINHEVPEDTIIIALTPREYEVALLAMDSSANQRTGNLLLISEKTVDLHLAHIYKKLGGVNNHYSFVARFTYLEMCSFFKEHEDAQKVEASV